MKINLCAQAIKNNAKMYTIEKIKIDNIGGFLRYACAPTFRFIYGIPIRKVEFMCIIIYTYTTPIDFSVSIDKFEYNQYQITNIAQCMRKSTASVTLWLIAS